MGLPSFPTLVASAPAKINLNLDITAKHTSGPQNGFHEISSLFHAIDWSDLLFLKPVLNTATYFSLNFSKASTFPVKSPTYDLYQDAPFAKIYQEAKKAFPSLPSGLHLTLMKNIPIGAGLGGGSSDIAAFLQAVVLWTEKSLWSKKQISFDDFPDEKKKWMVEMALSYGSDAAFFFRGGFSHITGRGEKIKHLPTIGEKLVLIYYCGYHVSTKEAYRLYDEQSDEQSDGRSDERFDERASLKRGNGEKVMKKLIDDLDDWQKNRKESDLSIIHRYQLVQSFLDTSSKNDFFQIMIKRIPHFDSLWRDFSNFLDLMPFFEKDGKNKIYKSMSGSGSSLYGLFHDTIASGEIGTLKRLCLEVNRTFTSGKEVDYRKEFRLPPRLFLARLFDRGVSVRCVG